MKKALVAIIYLLGTLSLHAQEVSDSLGAKGFLLEEPEIVVVPKLTLSTPVEYVPIFALKTNLLFDGLLLPNLELEIPFTNQHFSLLTEMWFPYIETKDHANCLYAMYGGLEGRYWLGDREKMPVFTGHFLGIYGGVGLFDIYKDPEGFQSEFFYTSGITYGYDLRVNDDLRLEFSISAGFFNTQYRFFQGADRNSYFVWIRNGIYSWMGPTKLKVSLVWTIFSTKKWGRR